MSERHQHWWRKLGGGLYQAGGDHAAPGEHRDAFVDGANFHTRFGYTAKREGIQRVTASRPGSSCLRTNYSKQGRVALRFGDYQLGGSGGEFLIGLSFRIPDDFILADGSWLPLISRYLEDGTITSQTCDHEFAIGILRSGSDYTLVLQGHMYNPTTQTIDDLAATYTIGASISSGWHRVDLQYHEGSGEGHALLYWDGAAADDQDFGSGYYWLDPVANETGVTYAGSIYLGHFPPSVEDLTVDDEAVDVDIAEFRYDETYRSTFTSLIGSDWVDGRVTSINSVDLDLVIPLDEGGGLVAESEADSGWGQYPVATLLNSQPAWHDGGLLLHGGPWAARPGFVEVTDIEGKGPLVEIMGRDLEKVQQEWTLYFRFDTPWSLGEDGTGDVGVIASQGFVGFTGSADESPSGWALFYQKVSTNWIITFLIRHENTSYTCSKTLTPGGTTRYFDTVDLTIVRSAGTIYLYSDAIGDTTASFTSTKVMQALGTEPLLFGAHYDSEADYEARQDSNPQAGVLLREFRALPYAITATLAGDSSWYSDHVTPSSDYLALLRFNEGQGDEVTDYSDQRLVCTIRSGETHGTFALGTTPETYEITRSGDHLPMKWVATFEAAPARKMIDAVTVHHHPQLGDTTVALGDGQAYEIDGATLTGMTKSAVSHELPSSGTINYTQFGGRLYLADGANRPQCVDMGRFRPVGMKPPSKIAKPGVMAFPGSDVTGYVTYMVCYENSETGAVSEGVVTDPIELDDSGALIGWGEDVPLIKYGTISQAQGAWTAQKSAADVTTWAPLDTWSFEGFIKPSEDETADVVLWTKYDSTPTATLELHFNGTLGTPQFEFWVKPTGGGAIAKVAAFDASLGVWNHVAWCCESAGMRFLKDGHVETTCQYSLTTGAGKLTFNVGAANTEDIEMTQWRFWNVFRDPDEVAAFMDTGILDDFAGDTLVFSFVPEEMTGNVDNWDQGSGSSYDYTLATVSQAPLPNTKDYATHLALYRSDPNDVGASPTDKERAEAKELAKSGPWRFVGRCKAGDSFFRDTCFEGQEGAMRTIGQSEPPPVGIHYVERYGVMVAYARTSKYPERVWFSREFNAEELPSATTWQDVEDGSGEPITGLQAYGEVLLVFKKSSIWSLFGTSPDRIQRQVVTKGAGTEAPRSVVEANGMVFFWGRQGPAVLSGTSVKSLATSVSTEVEKCNDNTGVIAVHDAKRHRVGWLVPTSSKAIILWFDYTFGVWTKDEPYLSAWGIDSVNGEIYLVDESGYVSAYDEDAIRDGHSAHSDTVTGTLTAGSLEVSGTFYATGDGLKGLPVLLLSGDGTVVWREVSENDASTLTITGATLAEDVTWYLGPIDWYVEKHWSDWSHPNAHKEAHRFFVRPTTNDQRITAKVAADQTLGDYENPSSWDVEVTVADGRYQYECWIAGDRFKWRLENPVPGVNGVFEAGFEGRISTQVSIDEGA